MKTLISLFWNEPIVAIGIIAAGSWLIAFFLGYTTLQMALAPAITIMLHVLATRPWVTPKGKPSRKDK